MPFPYRSSLVQGGNYSHFSLLFFRLPTLFFVQKSSQPLSFFVSNGFPPLQPISIKVTIKKSGPKNDKHNLDSARNHCDVSIPSAKVWHNAHAQIWPGGFNMKAILTCCFYVKDELGIFYVYPLWEGIIIVNNRCSRDLDDVTTFRRNQS